MTSNTVDTGLPAPIDELGIYLLPGRVNDPSRAITDAVEAERLGLTSAWLAERMDMKELGVLSGAVAASTRHIRVGMGAIAAGTRHPLADGTALNAELITQLGDGCARRVALD